MAAHTRHYHIEDIAANRHHAHLIPGEGAIDFEAVLRAILATGYQGWVTVELYPYIEDPDSAGRRARPWVMTAPSPICPVSCANRSASTGSPPYALGWYTAVSTMRYRFA